MSEKRVLVIGELNVDLILGGMRSLPTLGRETLASDFHVVLGSSSAICAAGLARLGVRVDFLGKVGTDHYGNFVVEQLGQLGIGTGHIQRSEAISTGVTVSLSYPTDRALVTYLGSIAALRLEDVDTSTLGAYDHLHVGSYFLQRGLQAGLPGLFHQARRAGLTTSLDTGHDPDGRWGGHRLRVLLDLVDLFLPNEEEARAISLMANAEDALQELAQHARLVVVKCGGSGAIALDEGRIMRSLPLPVEVVDTTGAGDSFDAGFIYAHVVRGFSVEESLHFANACGALSTTGVGGTAAQPTLEQVATLLEVRPG